MNHGGLSAVRSHRRTVAHWRRHHQGRFEAEPVDRPAEQTVDGGSAEPDVKLDGSRPTIIYTGNLGSSQALGPCIRAMAHLEHDAAVLKLIGAGDMKSELRQLRDDLGLADRVEFHGLVPRAEVPALLADATIGIAPLQDSEEMAYAMPTKLYEYLASGLPTVVTGRGEIERFIDASGGGFHVENDPEQIAAKFDELLADEQLREQLGRDGRAYVEANCDRKAIANRLSKKLSELVE